MLSFDGIYDLIVVGGGPAGLTAGLYSSRAGLKTLLLKDISLASQAALTDRVENYPGFNAISGFELMRKFEVQTQAFGVEVKNIVVSGISAGQDSTCWTVKTDTQEYRSLAVVIAAGAKPSKLGIPGEKDLMGRGVSYCAVCDGAFFRDKRIIVVGGGNTAVEEAEFLTKFGRKVT